SSDQIAIASQSHSRTGYQTDADPGSVANPTSGTWTTSNDPLFVGNGTQESVRVAAVFDDWQVVQFQITLPNQTTATVYGKVVSWNNAEVAFQAYTTFTDGAGPSGPFTNMGFFVVSEVANAVDGKSAANNSSDTNPGNTDRGAFSPGNPYQPLFLSPSTPQPNLALNPAGGTSIVGTPISSDDVAFVGAVQQDPTTHTFSVIPSQNDFTVTDFSQVQGTAVNVVIDQVFTVNNTQVAEVTFTPSGGSAQVFDAQLLGYNADSLLLQVLTNFNSANGTWYPDGSLNGQGGGAPFLVVSDASLAGTNGIPVNDVFTTNGTLAPYGLTNITPICFGAGTLISTPSGEVEVERLGTGDMVLTQAGAARRVVWVGRGQVMVSRGRRSPATPVIVRKGALADNVPHQDLRVTKGHAFHIDGVLIPVEFLVNHRSIIWDDMAQEVTIYHVELETHDVLLANGAPAESYRDDGNRWLFQNVNNSWDQPEKAPFAPVLTGGPVVDQAWRRLLDRSGPRRGVPLTDDPDLHLVVDGKRIDAEAPDEMVRVFTLPAAFRWVRIVSRSAVPEELGVTRDPRALGVALRRLVVRQGTWFRRIDIADPALSGGFHAYETEGRIRWTDGDAELPVSLLAGRSGRLELVLHLAATTQYIDTGKAIAKVA
ncbi:MAG: putative rane protein, partial [Rhodopila sp.]|nr:putative rane protein [Rhodopila sp.]